MMACAELVQESCARYAGRFEHGEYTSDLDTSLKQACTCQSAWSSGHGEPGFKLTEDPDTVRAPDVAFVSAERLAGLGRVRGYFLGLDLAVEVISPHDLYTEVAEKVDEWLEHGTRMVVVTDPRRQTVAVHRPGQLVRILGMDDVPTARTSSRAGGCRASSSHRSRTRSPPGARQARGHGRYVDGRARLGHMTAVI